MTHAVNLNLDNPERVVEIVPADGIEWETTGTAGEVAIWLGNATEADRQAIRLAAKRASAEGLALRVSFPSVMTFLLGHDGGRFRIHVPHDHDTASGCCDICGR
jgi:cell division inhibitor SulA